MPTVADHPAASLEPSPTVRTPAAVFQRLHDRTLFSGVIRAKITRSAALLVPCVTGHPTRV